MIRYYMGISKVVKEIKDDNTKSNNFFNNIIKYMSKKGLSKLLIYLN